MKRKKAELGYDLILETEVANAWTRSNYPLRPC
jgi:hypothetical protein